MSYLIASVAGTRPNFMKIAPIIRTIGKWNEQTSSTSYVSHLTFPRRISHILIHTGQHYDYDMSRVFFEDLVHLPILKRKPWKKLISQL